MTRMGNIGASTDRMSRLGNWLLDMARFYKGIGRADIDQRRREDAALFQLFEGVNL